MGNIAKIESTISEVEAQIECCIEPYKIERKLLESIPGVGKDGATYIIAEVGVDMDQFPEESGRVKVHMRICNIFHAFSKDVIRD